MVSMSDVQSILINDSRESLLRELASVKGKNDLQEVFAAWLCQCAMPDLDITRAVEVAIKAAGTQRNFAHVAILGLAAQVRALTSQESETLISSARVLVQREPVVAGTPMGFCMDGVALASVVLGAKAMGDTALWAETCRWLRKCRDVTARGVGLDSWQEWLLSRIAEHTGASWERKGTDDPEAAAVRVALRSQGIGADNPEKIDDERIALDFIRQASCTGIGCERATIRLSALDWIRRDRPVCDLKGVTAADVAELLRRIPTAMKKWTWEERPRTKTAPSARQWHIDNEYHVQNLLWLVLAPFLPNLVDEESTPKVGPIQPRADICVPSLRLIVEAKFMRAGDAPKKVVEQIAQDASIYLVSGSNYDKLIPFIWDDSRRTEHHEEMVRGLRQVAGVVDAVVVPRPGSMILQ